MRNWVIQAEVDAGERPVRAPSDAQRLAELEREVRPSNAILRSASALFAAELNRSQRRC